MLYKNVDVLIDISEDADLGSTRVPLWKGGILRRMHVTMPLMTGATKGTITVENDDGFVFHSKADVDDNTVSDEADLVKPVVPQDNAGADISGIIVKVQLDQDATGTDETVVVVLLIEDQA